MSLDADINLDQTQLHAEIPAGEPKLPPYGSEYS